MLANGCAAVTRNADQVAPPFSASCAWERCNGWALCARQVPAAREEGGSTICCWGSYCPALFSGPDRFVRVFSFYSTLQLPFIPLISILRLERTVMPKLRTFHTSGKLV